MGSAVLGAAAALAVVLLQCLITGWKDRRDRRRENLTASCRAVLGAAVRLRNKQYLKHRAREAGNPDTEQARQERYDARSELTVGRDALVLATGDPRIVAAAQEVFDSCVALGDAVTAEEIAAQGLRAREAHTTLLHATAAVLYR